MIKTRFDKTKRIDFYVKPSEEKAYLYEYKKKKDKLPDRNKLQPSVISPPYYASATPPT
eukprot:UN00383